MSDLRATNDFSPASNTTLGVLSGGAVGATGGYYLLKKSMTKDDFVKTALKLVKDNNTCNSKVINKVLKQIPNEKAFRNLPKKTLKLFKENGVKARKDLTKTLQNFLKDANVLNGGKIFKDAIENLKGKRSAKAIKATKNLAKMQNVCERALTKITKDLAQVYKQGTNSKFYNDVMKYAQNSAMKKYALIGAAILGGIVFAMSSKTKEAA